MIGVVDVEVQAANPQMPLYPFRAFVNSPSSVRVRNVPTEIGAWKITSVRVVVAYPDSSIKTADCVLAGSVWVATVAGCAVSGTAENGFTVFASGVDENGNAVSNYCLGKGNVEILKADGTLSPDAPSYYVHLFDEEPTAPNEGDMWPTSGGFAIWHDGEAHGSITVDSALSTTSENPVQNKVVTAAVNAKCTVAEAVAEVTRTAPGEWQWPETFEGCTYAPSRAWLNEHGDHGRDYYTIEYDGELFPEEGGWAFSNWVWEYQEVEEEYKWVPGAPEEAIDSDCTETDTTLTIPLNFGTLTATRTPTRNVNGLARLVDLEGKADKSEMSVTPGTGANADKTTIQLKTGTSATVLTEHQTWSDVKPSGGIPATDLASAVQTSLGKADTAVQPAGIAAKMPMYALGATPTVAQSVSVLAACFPIVYTLYGESSSVTVTAADAGDLSIARVEAGGGIVLYSVNHNGHAIFVASDQGVFADALGNTITFDGNTPTVDSTSVLDIKNVLTVSPYTSATYTADSTAAAFEIAVGALPAGVTGKARDSILVIDCTATGAVAPTVTWGTHFHPRTDVATDLAIVEAGKRAVFYISEYAAGEYAVGGWVETDGGSGT